MDPIQREVSGTALSVMPIYNDGTRLRAANTFNIIHKLGLHFPLSAVQDFLSLWTSTRSEDSLPIATNTKALQAIQLPPSNRIDTDAVAVLMHTLSRSEVVRRCQSWLLSDDFVAVLTAKVLGTIFQNWSHELKNTAIVISLPQNAEILAPQHLRPLDLEASTYFSSFYETLLANAFLVKHAVEQLDIDTLRLLGMFHSDLWQHAPLELNDLFRLFTTPAVNDVVNFSLQILPSALEVAKQRDAQVASMDGYEGVERLGHIDNLLLTEFAYDDDVFYQKFLDNELFYFARSRPREENEKLHYILIDASASMRGRRSVFARGVALAMIKKLLLQNAKILIRFFDSYLYDPVLVHQRFSPPYLLAFQSERGRNYARVFQQVLVDLRNYQEQRKLQLIVYILSHGQCHIPNDTLTRMRELAYLFGIFILPGPTLDLDYLHLLHNHRVISDANLNTDAHRKAAAIDILKQL